VTIEFDAVGLPNGGMVLVFPKGERHCEHRRAQAIPNDDAKRCPDCGAITDDPLTALAQRWGGPSHG
jgi:hypothetical protein